MDAWSSESVVGLTHADRAAGIVAGAAGVPRADRLLATAPSGSRPPGHKLAPIVRSAAACMLAAAAVAAAIALGTVDGWVGAVVVVAWAGAALVLWRRHRGPLSAIVASVAVAGTAVLAASPAADTDDAAAWVRAIAIAATGGELCHLAIALPDGMLRGRRGWAAAGGYVVAAVAAAVMVAQAPEVRAAPLVVASVALAALAGPCVVDRCRRADHFERAWLQWAGLAALVAATAVIAAFALSALTGWPARVAPVAIAATILVPAALVAATFEWALAVSARALAAVIVGAGMLLASASVYAAIVVGFNGAPSDEEQAALGLAMIATAVIAVFALPARRSLERFANQRVYGERESPDVALHTFATRMSRAVPMDELLLQLAETLRKTMDLRRAEIWTGTNGAFDLAVSVPSHVARRVVLGADEAAVAARTPVAGNAWLAIWMPALIEGREGQVVRVAAVAHLGELLGMIVTERDAGEAELDEEQEQVLGDIARQLGLALHNVKLDSALQASLDELQVRNAELVSSRARVVAAADESRRRIERDLHDGAQQHLVAMAVKLGLARQLLDADATTAATLVEELRNDVQVTLTELRELAHGIYPPLLRSRGLPEALAAAAHRATLDTTVAVAASLPRFDPDVEAAVYFCCLEAIQNANKHAGDGATVTVSVEHDEAELRFEVRDDGAGFDPHQFAEGHGFVNMADRLGAFGGRLTVDSQPGNGAIIAGYIPAEPLATEE